MKLPPSEKRTRFETTICGHRGGGGDLGNRESLTNTVDWSSLGHEPNHYDYRDAWANRKQTFMTMLDQGVRSFELDLMLSKDGEVMVVHNSCIDGKNVSQTHSTELEAKGCIRYPELLDAFEAYQQEHKTRITILNETKGSFSDETNTDAGANGVAPISAQLVKKVVSELNQRIGHEWDAEQLPIIGFNHKMLDMAKQLKPELEIGLTYGKENFLFSEDDMQNVTTRNDYPQMVQRMVDEALEAGAYAINPDNRLVTRELVNSAHDAGLLVQSWSGFNMPERQGDMIEAGVDTLITDCPKQAQELLSQMRRESLVRPNIQSRAI